ncbi:MAG: hypothetical protein KDA94_09065 [Acidimicrobiales bacterium]|nr:hypothetical protein [Acidimicrobiales bacterium]
MTQRRREALIVFGAWAVVVVPLAVAALAAMRPRWFPIQDLAQYELRVRDVGGRHTPLIGLAGRIGPWYDPGSHPGPLSFWFLAPVYRLLGGSAAALIASSVTLHAVAFGLVLWMARRRGGVPLVLATAAALAVLVRFYGPNLFIEPWNPYLPVSWWLVLLFAVWGVLDGDPPMLVVAVVAGSFCAQTHLPYVGLVGGLVALVLASVGLTWWRDRRGRRDEAAVEGASAEPDPLRRLLRWTGGAAVLGVVLWLPPIIDQIWGVGNLTRIKDSVSHPTEAVSGVRHGPAELLRNLDPTAVFGHRDLTTVSTTSGICWPAVLLVVAWAAAAVVAWRRRDAAVVRLHVVVAAALGLAAFSSTRIYGLLWKYLFLWAWGLMALMVLAIAATIVTVLRDSIDPGSLPRFRRAAMAALALVTVVVSVASGVADRDVRPARPDLSAELGVVSGEAIEAIESEEVPGFGPSGRYLVRWDDPVTIGSQGWGLVNELERAGLQGGFDAPFGVGGTKHRVLDEDDATAILQLVVSDREIARWDATDGATRVGYVDLRTPEQRSERARIVDEVEQELLAAGLDKQAREWIGNAFTTSLDPAVPPEVAAQMREALAIPAPVAVYLVAPDRSDG